MDQHEILKRFISVLVKGKQSSLVVVSPAGYGKTEATLKTLNELNLKENQHFKYIPNYITPKGLVQELQEVNSLYPPRILVLDDGEDTLRNSQSIGILKGGLWATPDGRKRVSWITSREQIEFDFHGKIVFLLNQFNTKNTLIRALKDRAMFFEMKLSNDDMMKLMEKRAEVPFENIPIDQRRKIFQFLQKVANGSENITLRLLPKAYQMFMVSPNHYQRLILELLK